MAGKDVDALQNGGLVIAYEPVWAIGTGRNASGADAAAMAAAIRSTLAADLGWGLAAENVPVLYGGSVTSANIGEFLAEHSLDGALVGGASLKPDEMAGMVARAAVTAMARVAASGAPE
jgi:triosephosphate isomerase